MTPKVTQRGNSFAADIEWAAGGEKIIGVTIGEFGWSGRFDDEPEIDSKEKCYIKREYLNIVLTWDKARPMLDYGYSTGFGAPDCHAITAWTESYVLFVVQYDGSTAVHRVARNPIAHTPHMPGG